MENNTPISFKTVDNIDDLNIEKGQVILETSKKQLYIDNGNNDIDRIKITDTSKVSILPTDNTKNQVLIQNSQKNEVEGKQYTSDKISDTIISRDSNGRSKIDDPLDDYEITNKRYVDNKIQNSFSDNYITVGKTDGTQSGQYVTIEGYNNIAEYDYQTIVGKNNYNKNDTLFEIGNGTDAENRSNAFEVDINGHIYAGNEDIDTDNNKSLVTKKHLENYFYSKEQVNNNFQDKLSDHINIKTINNESILGPGNISTPGGEYITAGQNPNYDMGTNTTAEGKKESNIARMDYSYVGGKDTIAAQYQQDKEYYIKGIQLATNHTIGNKIYLSNTLNTDLSYLNISQYINANIAEYVENSHVAIQYNRTDSHNKVDIFKINTNSSFGITITTDKNYHRLYLTDEIQLNETNYLIDFNYIDKEEENLNITIPENSKDKYLIIVNDTSNLYENNKILEIDNSVDDNFNANALFEGAKISLAYTDSKKIDIGTIQNIDHNEITIKYNNSQDYYDITKNNEIITNIYTATEENYNSFFNCKLMTDNMDYNKNITSAHAEGIGTIANQEAQTVVGKYNSILNDNNLFVVGNGDSHRARSNAFEVDQKGHAKGSSPTDPIDDYNAFITKDCIDDILNPQLLVPSGYTRLEYIQSKGTGGILGTIKIGDEKATQDTEIIIEFALAAIPNASEGYTANNYVFGTRQVTDQNSIFLAAYQSKINNTIKNYWGFYFGHSTSHTSDNYIKYEVENFDTDWHILKMNKTSISIDNITLYEFTNSKTFTTPLPIHIGGCYSSDSGTQYFNGKVRFRKYQEYSKNKLIHYCVPAQYKKITNETEESYIGMYDIIDKTTYDNGKNKTSNYSFIASGIKIPFRDKVNKKLPDEVKSSMNLCGVYGTDINTAADWGVSVVGYNEAKMPSTIPIRDNDGFLSTSIKTPEKNYHVTSKGYVDNQINTINNNISTINTSINTINTEINTIKNNVDFIPNYVKTEANRVSDLVRNDQITSWFPDPDGTNVFGKSITFVSISDLHYSVDDTYKTEGGQRTLYRTATQVQEGLSDMRYGIKEIAKQTHIDFYASFGDIIYRTGGYTSFNKGVQEINAATKLINDAFDNNAQVRMTGNHDPNCVNTSGYYFDKELMNTYMGIYNTNFVRDENYPYGGYGYCDFERQKVRMFVLNTSFYDGVINKESWSEHPTRYNLGTNQAKWICNTLLELNEKTDANNWNIIFLSHVALDTSSQDSDNRGIGKYTPLINAYINGGTIAYDGTTFNFSGNNQAKIKVFINGHTHNYNFGNMRQVHQQGKITVIDNVFPILRIDLPNALDGREDASFNGVTYNKTPDSDKSTTFVVMTIDFDKNIIYERHYGAGIDIIYHYEPLLVSTNTEANNHTTTVTPSFTAASWASSNISVATFANNTITGEASGCTTVYCLDNATAASATIAEVWNVQVEPSSSQSI